jgi:hypothetical protein
MENSSLIHLKDNDVILMLEDYILIAYNKKRSNELEDARKFHENNFQNCIDINKDNHYLISFIFGEYIYRLSGYYWSIEKSKLVDHRIKIYEESLKEDIETTELQRCQY